MSFKVQCDRCGLELNEPGGLMFSPPSYNEVLKWHVCVACWDAVQSAAFPQYAAEWSQPRVTKLHALMGEAETRVSRSDVDRIKQACKEPGRWKTLSFPVRCPHCNACCMSPASGDIYRTHDCEVCHERIQTHVVFTLTGVFFALFVVMDDGTEDLAYT